jgi:MoaA/NifB/PqqE/SkfB family radical SAM enzyme
MNQGLLGALARVPLYQVARRTGRLRPAPLNLTFSVTYRCNATCKTCDVWRKRVDDFTLAEYEQTFRQLGAKPYWLTFSGGEPFIRPDLIDIILSAYRNCRPGIITIPTNGLLVEQIVDGVERLARGAPRSSVIINLSLDGVGARHDAIRGVPGNYAKVRETYERLRSLTAPNLTVGIHAVVSRLNVADFPALHRHVRDELRPASFITELAEERVELNTVGMDITPTPAQYLPIVDRLVADIESSPARGVAGLAQSFRRRYYEIAHRTLIERRQVLPCYAGLASAHVAPNGDVWTCCTRAEPMGNLREAAYDLDRVWRSAKADDLRSSIQRLECHCPLANAAYSSMLCDSSNLLRVGWHWLKATARGWILQGATP